MTKKPFTWSYSKLKNFETCAKKHWHVDLTKDVKEEENENLLWGNEVHKYAALRLSKKQPLPPAMANSLEEWCKKIEEAPAKLFVEQKLAITRDYTACGWFDHNVWFRAVCDVVQVSGPVACVRDWKTGKILQDSQQLGLAAACIFAHYPEVQMVFSEFIWLKEGPGIKSDDKFFRERMPEFWRGLLPRVKLLEDAYYNDNYPPNPSRLCRRHCPVSSCPYHGVAHG